MVSGKALHFLVDVAHGDFEAFGAGIGGQLLQGWIALWIANHGDWQKAQHVIIALEDGSGAIGSIAPIGALHDELTATGLRPFLG
ncbi:hypothetical protein PbB2_02865 [Candidatus Phycosocius bacilliformis]|uniref:Uncharacterized protein n=1 Tax=Candidatus Phycosocius bacilliformis TaxID=1445552 RepID=A0A2P2EDM6_9PROT|nr:hypothetical protein PbB2_02865 [Candidatus Phycosocius bacilliformis]